MSEQYGETASIKSRTGRTPTEYVKIRQALSSQENFGQYITSPMDKDEPLSSDEIVGNNDFVTPDELFGPTSPSRSQKRHSGNVVPKAKSHKSQGKSTNESSNSKRSSQQLSPNLSNNSPTSNTDRPSDLRNFSMSVTRNNVNVARSKLYRHGDYNNGGNYPVSSFNHTDILDENLNISESKLDTTLIRLFSRNSTGKGNYSSFDQNQEPQLLYQHADFIGLEPVMWRVHPMNSTHKETLNREMDFIAQHVKPREIITQLYSEGILTSMDYNQLTRTEGQGDKAVTRLMLRTLQRRGSKAYPALINALLAGEYFFICERLSHSGQDLYNGIVTNRGDSDWRKGIQFTPYGHQTPYKRLSPAYVAETPTFSYGNPFLSPQTEPWTYPNRMSLFDPVPMLSNSMPERTIKTPESIIVHDLQVIDPLRVEQRLEELDDGLRLMRQEIASLKNAGTQPTSLDPRPQKQYRSRKSFSPQTEDDPTIDPEYLEDQLSDIKSKLAQLRDLVSELTAARLKAFKKENSSTRWKRNKKSSKVRVEKRATPPTHHVTNDMKVDVQLRELQEKIKDLRCDIMALTASSSLDLHAKDTDSMSSSSVERTDQDDQHRKLYAEKLDGHLQALRTQIKMLHDDITALKTARSINSTNQGSFPTRTARKQVEYSTTHINKAKPRPPMEIEHDKGNVSNSNVNPEPISNFNHYPSFTRYPSRFSPRDAVNRQTISRSDKIKHGQGDRHKAARNKHTTNNEENKKRRSKKNPRIDDYNDSGDWFDFKDDDDIFSKESKEPRANKDGKSFQKDEGKDQPYRNRFSNLPVDNNKLRPENDVHTFNEKQDTFYKNRNNDSSDTWDEDIDARSKNGRNQNNNHSEIPVPKDEHVKGRKLNRTTEDTAPTLKTRQPIPIIITPDEKNPEQPGSKNYLPVQDYVPLPREKKKVRYDTNEQSSDNDTTQRYKQQRPMTRAANAAHRKPTHALGNNKRLPVSSSDYFSSDEYDYARVTTPTRILSPPIGPPFERVTTPYKILRNPNNRRITTWSKKSSRRKK